MMKRSTMGSLGEGWLTREQSLGFLPGWSGPEWLGALALMAAVFVAYLPVWHAGFVLDDVFYLQDNPALLDLNGLKTIWTTSSADICPLTTTTFWVEHALWGFAPLPYHLVNVLAHGACAVALRRVLLVLKAPGAWLGAALWALHPVNVESVAWISELKNPQSGLFFLIAIFYFVRWLKVRAAGGGASGYGEYGLAFLFSALAMATKSSTVVLPAVLCLVAWWMEGRWDWRNLARVAPIFLLTLAASAVSIWTQSLALTTLDDPTLARSWPERIATGGIAVWFYLWKLAWPHPVMTGYPRWNIDATNVTSYLPLLAVVVALFILWLKRRTWGRAPFLVFAYFLCALLPVLGLFDTYIFQYSQVFDHFVYLASMGVLALAGAGLARLVDEVMPGRRNVLAAGGVALMLVLAILSWQRASTFASEETLWADTAAKNPESWTAHYHLGVVRAQAGRNLDAEQHYRRAIELYPRYVAARISLGILLGDEGHSDAALAEIDEALKIDPRSGSACNAKGWLLWRAGRVDEAMPVLKQATELDPRSAKARFTYGAILLQKGELDAAISELGKAVKLNPHIAEVYSYLGQAFMKKGQVDQAIPAFEKSLEIEPTHADVHDYLGQALVQKGQLDAGVIQYQKALEIDPKSGQTESDLGVALLQAGFKDEAMKHLRRSLELDPSAMQPNLRLGNALLGLGQVDAAIVQYEKTVQLAPAFADARRNLGVALMMKGQAGEAITQLQEGLRLNPGDRGAQELLEKAQAIATQKAAGKTH